tara:strand:- start:58 stop:300 length:243 start_codon:yes stop_codon:yes gene_type:complete
MTPTHQPFENLPACVSPSCEFLCGSLELALDMQSGQSRPANGAGIVMEAYERIELVLAGGSIPDRRGNLARVTGEVGFKP